MPRPTQGHVVERQWADGKTISYGAQLRAYGRYEKVTFGTNKQGWNRTRAELETERIMQQIERGTWVPPRLQPREDRLEEAMAALGVQVDETFRLFANRWWRSKQLDLAEKTFVDYSWRLAYLEPFSGRCRLSEITPRLVDRFRDELAEQAHTIRLAEQRGRPVMESATDKRGRTYERRRRPLSNTSISMLITLLGQILQQAVDYELIDRNPVRVGGRSARFFKRARPDRTFLEVGEFHDLTDAAAELEAEAPANRQGLGRRAMIATLGLAGFRIGEMMDLKVAQVDLQRCRFKLADAKTEAGVREVEITLYLRDELLAYAMDRRAWGLPLGPSDHFFGTATGNRRDPDRFRDRILARAVTRANANRAESGMAPLPPITPHSLRRSWATFCAMIGATRNGWRLRSDTSTQSSHFRSTSRSRPAGTSTSRPCGRSCGSPTSPPSACRAARSLASSAMMRGGSRGSRRASSTAASTASLTALRMSNPATDVRRGLTP